MPEVTAPPVLKTPSVGLPKDYVRIVLEDNDNIPPTGQPISINGRAYIVKPGVEVDVPPAVLEVLDNAIMSTPIMDPQTKRIIGTRDRKRFPYRLVRDEHKRPE